MATSQSTDVSRLQSAFARSIHDHRLLFLAEGIVLTILGLLAFLIPPLAILTLVLIVFFVIKGIASTMYALERRQRPSGRWGWMLFSGIVGPLPRRDDPRWPALQLGHLDCSLGST
jgi:uncharacterized membrane protein HdeD (DUF308 family)